MSEAPRNLGRSHGLLRGLVRQMSRRNLDLIAAGVAFYAMLAVFPAAAAVIALWGIVADPVIVNDQLGMLEGLIPPAGFAVLENQVLRLIDNQAGRLGWASLISTAAALWATRAGVGALVRGLNAIYGKAPRSGFWHALAALALTLALVALALVALAAVVAVPVVVAFLPLGPASALGLSIARWTLLGAVGVSGLWLVYKFGPNHGRRSGRVALALPGVALALVLWAAASWAFTAYLDNFASFTLVYGSIGAVVILLMWVYLSAYAVLIGAALNAVLARGA